MISLICLLRFLFPYWKYGTIVDKNTIKNIIKIVTNTILIEESIGKTLNGIFKKI